MEPNTIVHQLLFFFCFAVILGFTLYMFIHFTYILASVSKLKSQQTNQTMFNSKHLEELLNKAITILKKHANAFSQPYFYDRPPEIIISTLPDYVTVIELCRYIYKHPDSGQHLNRNLVDLYGDKYERSPQLNVLVSTKTSEFGSQERFHYVLIDIEKSTKYYLANKEFFDKLLRQRLQKPLS